MHFQPVGNAAEGVLYKTSISSQNPPSPIADVSSSFGSLIRFDLLAV